jgi:hypothetical protein
VRRLVTAGALIIVIAAAAAALVLALDDTSGKRNDDANAAAQTAEDPPIDESAVLPDCLSGTSTSSRSYRSYGEAIERAEQVLDRPLPLPDKLPEWVDSASAGEIRTFEGVGEDGRKGPIAGAEVGFGGARSDPTITIAFLLIRKCYEPDDPERLDVNGIDVRAEDLPFMGPSMQFTLDGLLVEVRGHWFDDAPDDDAQNAEMLDWTTRVIESRAAQ